VDFDSGYRAIEGYGVIRLLGFGIHWKPFDSHKYFSERNGYTKFWRIGSKRFRLLAPWR